MSTSSHLCQDRQHSVPKVVDVARCLAAHAGHDGRRSWKAARRHRKLAGSLEYCHEVSAATVQSTSTAIEKIAGNIFDSYAISVASSASPDHLQVNGRVATAWGEKVTVGQSAGR